MEHAFRSTEVKDLKVLALPEEGGTRKDYDDFLETFERHVGMTWTYGSEIAHVVKEGNKPNIDQPEDIEQSKKAAWEIRLWNQEVDEYGIRVKSLRENMKALFSMILANVLKIARSKIISSNGFSKANNSKDALWLLCTLDDVMLDFQKIKYPVFAVDDQMENIMTRRQKTTDTNEEFVKSFMKDIKVYEKYGGKFLWGEHQEKQLKK